MEPEQGRVYCGDCLDIMRGWPAGCVDAVITDPPYGMQAGAQGALRGKAAAPIGCGRVVMNRDYGAFKWDESRPSPAHFDELLRLSKIQALFGGNFFADMLPATRCWYCWDKGRRNDFADCELVWTSLDAPARVINYHYDGCMTADPKRELPRLHPTQKPLPVMERLISDLTKEGDLVLDPFCGSGTTLTACERLGRRWIGIDVDPHWCDVARRRTAQKGLFTLPPVEPEEHQHDQQERVNDD